MSKKRRQLTFQEIRQLISEGRKITKSFLYEEQNCKDGSEFVNVPDHPLGIMLMRIWPTE